MMVLLLFYSNHDIERLLLFPKNEKISFLRYENIQIYWIIGTRIEKDSVGFEAGLLFITNGWEKIIKK